MRLSFVNLLQILISFQGLSFLLFLVTHRKGKRSSNLALAVLLGLLAAHMITLLLQDQGLVPQRIAIPQLFALLYGPLLYLYVRGLIYRHLSLSSREALHLLPFLAALAARPTPWLTPSRLAIAIFASMGSYLMLSFQALNRYRRVLHSTRSRFEGITLSWLRWILIGVSVIVVLDMTSFFSSASPLYVLERIVSATVFAAFLVFVNALVIKGLRQPELFAGITLEDEAIAREARRTGQRPPASPQEEASVRRVVRFMEAERPHLDPNLTLAGLARALGMPARDLSRLINRRFDQNFSDFVNTYRIEEAKRRLVEAETAGETILDVLYAVGFNSKSAFNAAFKRKTGSTPTEYRNRHRP